MEKRGSTNVVMCVGVNAGRGMGNGGSKTLQSTPTARCIICGNAMSVRASASAGQVLQYAR